MDPISYGRKNKCKCNKCNVRRPGDHIAVAGREESEWSRLVQIGVKLDSVALTTEEKKS